ncbi:MAG TPA: aminoglycoside phosphotransferase family protein, partial [Clostridia bacterium]|nr:aminoglycoside phosphotransferase family protein [Clostridia bacterium]
FIKGEPCGSGHINDTYAVSYKDDEGSNHCYILQWINHKVFKEPEKLMENISGITRYMYKKIKDAGGDPMRETLNLIPTLEDKDFYKSPDGDYWRAYFLIEGAKTYQLVENPQHFYKGGKAFGNFQKILKDYPAEELHDTIPNFHNTKMRFDALVAAVEGDIMNRAQYVEEEIQFAYDRADDTPILVDLLEKEKLPLRVTHNDTKFDNVMIDDKTGEGICIIDLDTVMPGLSLYDFGDSIRFGASTGAEDERDLSNVWMDLDLFEQFTKGFLEAAGDSLTQTELDWLAFSAKVMTLECGIRFLTDYLNGDAYFKIQREGHNLDRTRTQFKLVEDMEIKMDEMKRIVGKYR